MAKHGASSYKAGCRCDVCRDGKRIEQRAYVEMVRLRDGVTPNQKRSGGSGRRRPGVCSKCGANVIGTTLAEPICRTCRGKRPGETIRISAAGRRAIFERDEWTCQICLDPVDPATPTNTKWDATLDHITPRSKGGDDDPSNLRLAHRWCNSVRNDLSYYTDEDLRVA